MIFNAQKTKGANFKGTLTFDQVDINIGDGFDGSSGIFKVPVTGTYKMNFSGQSGRNEINYTFILFYKNGSVMFEISDVDTAENAKGKNVSYTWIMTLVKGDELKLESVNYLCVFSDEPLTFSGELIHI